MSATTIHSASGYEFRIDTVFRRTLACLRRGALLYALLGIAYAGLGEAIGRASTHLLWNDFDVIQYLYQRGLPDRYGYLAAVVVRTTIVLWLVGACTHILSALAVLWTRDLLEGQRPALWRSLATGLSVMPALLIVALAASFLSNFGRLLLVVPGFVVAGILWVAAPACSFEKLRDLAALRRSFDLSRGRLWRILVLLYLPWLLLTGARFGASHLIPRLDLGYGVIWSTYVGVQGALMALYGGFQIALTCVVYFELRSAREGLPRQSVAGIFD
ncbi:hypothetical protein [Labrys neptuniae]